MRRTLNSFTYPSVGRSRSLRHLCNSAFLRLRMSTSPVPGCRVDPPLGGCGPPCLHGPGHCALGRGWAVGPNVAGILLHGCCRCICHEWPLPNQIEYGLRHFAVAPAHARLEAGVTLVVMVVENNTCTLQVAFMRTRNGLEILPWHLGQSERVLNRQLGHVCSRRMFRGQQLAEFVGAGRGVQPSSRVRNHFLLA